MNKQDFSDLLMGRDCLNEESFGEIE